MEYSGIGCCSGGGDNLARFTQKVRAFHRPPDKWQIVEPVQGSRAAGLYEAFSTIGLKYDQQ